MERAAAARVEPVAYLAEGSDEMRRAVSELLVRVGFRVRVARDGTMMFEWLFLERHQSRRPPDLVVMDYRMSGYCALDILECLMEVRCTIPVIVIAAHGSDLRSMALALGARAVLERPFDANALTQSALKSIEASARS